MLVKMKVLLVISLCLSVDAFGGGWGGGGDSHNDNRVKLSDIQVLTLRGGGAMTTGRRTSPVTQIACVGGTAMGNREAQPDVVQCYNRGWDGREVQWECKADLDNRYRFGRVEVVCEGYDYPEDPYILAGSCGLEYTLDLTQEGKSRQQGGGGYKEHSYHNTYTPRSDGYSSKWSGLSDLIILGVMGLVIYALYRTCVSQTPNVGDRQWSSTDSDYPGSSPGAGGWSNPSAPPPTDQGYQGDGSCGGSGRRRGTGAGGMGGFWSGAGMGGILGYMMGNRNNSQGYNRGYGSSGYRTGGYGSTGFTNTGGFSSSTHSSGSSTGGTSGTRTASGFGGTRRR